MHAAKGLGHMIAAFAYNAVGDTLRAKKHARLAVETGLVNSEGRETDVEVLNGLRRDPTTHWTYMARRFAGGR